MYFKQWTACAELNKKCINSVQDAKYILLICQSKRFVLEEDLQTLFKNKLKGFQYEKLFRKMRCYLMYFTVFTQTEKRLRGPIAEDTSTKICTILLRKMNIPLNVVIVGPNYLKNKFNVITIDQFNLSFC